MEHFGFSASLHIFFNWRMDFIFQLLVIVFIPFLNMRKCWLFLFFLSILKHYGEKRQTVFHVASVPTDWALLRKHTEQQYCPSWRQIKICQLCYAQISCCTMDSWVSVMKAVRRRVPPAIFKAPHYFSYLCSVS